MKPHYTQSTNMLSSAPKSDYKRVATNTEPAPAVKPRYNSTDEMRAEFGDYRVNKAPEGNLCDSNVAKSVASDVVTNDPYTEQASNKNEGY